LDARSFRTLEVVYGKRKITCLQTLQKGKSEMTEEVKETISIEVVEFTLTEVGCFSARSNKSVVTPGLYVPLRTVVKLVGDISKQQNEGFRLVTTTLRGLVKGAEALLEKK
jgi:hypothetical protein